MAWQQGVWKTAQGDAKTQAKQLVDGRVRSVGEIVTTGWTVGDGVYDVKARYSMYAGQRYVQCDLTVTAQKGQGARFAVGLMKLQNEKGDIDVDGGQLSLWGDRIGVQVEDLGLSIVFRPARGPCAESGRAGRRADRRAGIRHGPRDQTAAERR